MKNNINIQKYEKTSSPILDSGCLYNNKLYLKFRSSDTIYRFSTEDLLKYYLSINKFDNLKYLSKDHEQKLNDTLIQATNDIFNDENNKFINILNEADTNIQNNVYKRKCSNIIIVYDDPNIEKFNIEKTKLYNNTIKNDFNDLIFKFNLDMSHTDVSSIYPLFYSNLLYYLNDIMIYDQLMNKKMLDPTKFKDVQLGNETYWFYTRLETINKCIVWYPALNPASWYGVKSNWPK